MTGHGHITGAAATLVESIDSDAVEASCLAHDLGHPPFGHIAEEVLHDEAKKHVDGFEGNAQSFRIATRLVYRASGSLNLTRQTLDGLLKYPWHYRPVDPRPDRKRERKWGYYEEDAESFEFARSFSEKDTDQTVPEESIEAWLMEWADDLTYAVHDVDDFFRAGLIPLDRLADPQGDELKYFQQLLQDAYDADPRGFPSPGVERIHAAAANAIAGEGPTAPYRFTRSSRRDMRSFGSALITRYLSAFTIHDDPGSGKIKLKIDDDADTQVEALKMLVRVYVIRRPGLGVVQHGQQRLIRDLFNFYFDASPKVDGDRRLFPPGAKERLDNLADEPAPRARVVLDLISGLTEDAAIQLHHRLAGGWTAPTLDATAQIG
jgi:dGTPase